MELLYLRNSYLREFDAEVVSSGDGKVGLTASGFYPGGGGQPADIGRLVWDGGECVVAKGGYDELEVEGDLPPAGTALKGTIDWDRRYLIMRSHTSLHVIAGIAHKEYGVHITGNNIGDDGTSRMDLSFENLSREMAVEIIARSNEVVSQNIPVNTYYITKEEFGNRPELMRVASHLYEKYDEIRLVDIVDFDVQADGGTHVANTKEIGVISLKQYKSKGAVNKRIYVTVD